ncbi:MAG: DUF2071 domain-containing protein [Pirellulales bacterium]
MPEPTLEQRIEPSRQPKRWFCMWQTWQHLAFIHWRFPAEELQKKLPPGLTIDQFDGSAWLGLVPFRMRAIRPVGLPALPWLSYFLEMNLRTYVYDRHGRPGVWFFSLDCNQPIAVRIARRLFHLPYYDARMSEVCSDGEQSTYKVQRRGETGTPQEETLKYRLMEDLPKPLPGTLEHFLLERYLLFAWDAGRQRLLSGQVHHTPYPPCGLELEHWITTPIKQAGLTAPKTPPDHCIASRGVKVKVYWLESVGD